MKKLALLAMAALMILGASGLSYGLGIQKDSSVETKTVRPGDTFTRSNIHFKLIVNGTSGPSCGKYVVLDGNKEVSSGLISTVTKIDFGSAIIQLSCGDNAAIVTMEK